jgi:hypothetical protein
MNARGITATSGRQLRSCEGGIAIHHASTPRNTASATSRIRRRRESQTAHMANSAKAAASARRTPAHGRFE